MLLEIDDTKTVADLQERFSLCFPYLKIELYKEPHHWQESSSPDSQLDPMSRIGDIRKNHDAGILEIKSWHKTGEVESLFRKLFGLNVQIFRLEKNAWKQSTNTDNLTLAMQTKMAMSRLIK